MATGISEDEDVLSSIRTVRELLNKEFGHHNTHLQRSQQAGGDSTATQENSWKAQVFQLKQAHYEEKLRLEAELEIRSQQLSRLQQLCQRLTSSMN